MRPLLRLAYRAILRLHPHAFRDEFGDEMLWIFDEESRNGDASHLIFDGVRSIVIQNTKPRIREAEAGVPYYCEIESSIPAVRFTQAGFVVLSCLCCLFCLSLFLSMVLPKVTVPERGWLFTRIKIFSTIPAPVPHRVKP